MREIKFRVFSNGAMHYGGFSVHSTSGNIIPDFPFISNQDPLMQYTGLKDKNGKEIYEGDIVNGRIRESSDGPEELLRGGEVKYNHGHWSYGRWIALYVSEVEVMGNIHENPELLQK